MDPSYEHLVYRAATIDELLSDAFEQLPGQKSDSDLAARRLAAWCRSSASGDWSLFARRLARDGLSIESVLARFATVRRNTSQPAPTWIDDAVWIGEALHSPAKSAPKPLAPDAESCAFEDLLEPVVRGAEARLWSKVDNHVLAIVGERARACLRRSLMVELSNLVAPAIYERFAAARNDVRYEAFVADMKVRGFRRLFDDKPVLLRLIASLTRQWIDTSAELITRLDADLPAIRCGLLAAETRCEITSIDADLSDPHNFGRTVRIIGFDDGSRIVYKPKDLAVDVAWYTLIERLNRSAPIELRAPRVLSCAGYGWTEFIDHTSCPDPHGFRRFFRRAGAWLALFHCFAGIDMHQENIIAAGDHPVPIDLEMILQAAEPPGLDADEGVGRAFDAAMEKLRDSVLATGLLPTYGKHSDSVVSIGGVASNATPRFKLTWTDINSDEMRPAKVADIDTISNLPHAQGRHAQLGDYIDDFRSGFTDYAMFLQRQRPDDLFGGFAGLTVRRVARPTRFYYMLLQRLKDHRTMDDGIMWSAQADFVARLADWQDDSDPMWPLQRLARAAGVELNVPHVVMASDGHEIRDAAGTSIPVKGMSGLDRARARVRNLDENDIAWQAEVIRQSTASLGASAGAEPKRELRAVMTVAPSREVFTAEADAAARTLFDHAFFGESDAAWIGLDWLGDSAVSHLVALGDDLYNGTCGIALFLAAHAAVANAESSMTLAIAAISRLRETIRGRNPSKIARMLGLGGGLGLGSIVYSLAVIAALLDNDDVLSDAARAAQLITPDVISADRQLDVLAGSAGAILGLLRVYRQTGSGDLLERATNCGRHLLTEHRVGTLGQRSWPAPGSGSALSGMSHGAAGFAYALGALAAATGSAEFASAAEECIAFENATFDAEHRNWPDIGLARVAMTKHTALDGQLIRTDIRRALAGAERGWPEPTDTLSGGTLANIEFMWEAGGLLGRDDLRDSALQRLLAVTQTAQACGDYRWTSGTRPFNLGLFRGIAGVGYTMLRRVDPSLPNALIWE
ncbi:hypothetical protein MSIMFI_05413 [Mycobacterium simulans]|nr:hypothetical protein MSIMFI_05413 [Mycobacterium simulans]